MLTDRIARAFPLLLLSSLAGLAAWLNTATEVEALMPPMARNQADTIMNDTRTIMYAENGQPLYQLNAAVLKHIPENDVSLLENALLVRTLTGTPVMRVTGQQATLSQRGQQIEFSRNVKLVREAAPGSDPMEITTSQLKVNTQAGTASTSQAAQARSPSQQINTVGLDYDHNNARLTLKSKAQISYVPKPH